MLAPSALAVAAAVAVVVVMVNGSDERVSQPAVAVQTVPIDAPRAVLQQAALMAERREASGPPRDEQWIYRMVTTRQSGDSARKVQEHWIRYDGTEWAARYDKEPVERRAIKPDPDDDDLTPKQYAAKLAELPTDPDKLLAHVKSDRHWLTKPEDDPGGKEHPDALAFRVLSVYLEQEMPMSPKLEAAVFRALAKIPGIRADPGVPDAMGRKGIGLAYDAGALRDAAGRIVLRAYIVLDPRTYEFLGRRDEHLQDEVLDGEVLSRKGTYTATAKLDSGVVDAPGLLP